MTEAGSCRPPKYFACWSCQLTRYPRPPGILVTVGESCVFTTVVVDEGEFNCCRTLCRPIERPAGLMIPRGVLGIAVEGLTAIPAPRHDESAIGKVRNRPSTEERYCDCEMNRSKYDMLRRRRWV